MQVFILDAEMAVKEAFHVMHEQVRLVKNLSFD